VVESGVPGCQYPLCPLNETIPPSDCLNLHTLTSWDLVLDVDSAVAFLVRQSGINAKKISVIGHSEGCTIAPYAANNHTGVVQNVVLLAGPGLSIPEVAIDQLARAVIYAETILNACTAANAPAPTLQELAQNLNLTIQLLEQTTTSTALILNGTYSDTELVQWLGLISAGYVRSLNEMGQFMNIFAQMNQFTSNGGSVLSINSPTDSQIYPKIYEPLHAVLLGLPFPQTVAIVDSLTHVLTPSNLSSGLVSTTLLQTILLWLETKPN